MTKSMTAFARVEGDQMAWEIRSVNQRYLDLTFRMPDHLRGIEPELRNLLRNKVHRGKIECNLRLESGQGIMDADAIDFDQLDRITRLLAQLADTALNLTPVSPLELLKWPGVMKESAADADLVARNAVALFQQAAAALTDMRDREGQELEQLVLERLATLESLVQLAREQAPVIQERLATRLREKIAEIAVDADPGRLEQELVYIAQKTDVREELDRLDTHIKEVRKTLAEDAGIGRRLDFLMQELNREANTLSSKAATADTAIQAVELKVIIEQMREQIQNIE